MTVYSTAQFQPTNANDSLIRLPSVLTFNACACRCYNHSLCVTATFFGFNQTCILFSSFLWEGQIQLTINISASVFSFSNRITKIRK